MAALSIRQGNSTLNLNTAQAMLKSLLPADMHQHIDAILANPRQQLQQLKAKALDKVPAEYRFLFKTVVCSRARRSHASGCHPSW